MDKGYDLTTVYDGCEARDVRPIIPLRQTPGVRLGQHKPPDVRARRMARRWIGLRARREQVALPDRRVQARLRLDQGRPAAPADPARDAPLHGPVTVAARQSSASSAASRTIGRWLRCASVDWTGFGSTPT
jgi:hypothetical protein